MANEYWAAITNQTGEVCMVESQPIIFAFFWQVEVAAKDMFGEDYAKDITLKRVRIVDVDKEES